MGGPAARGAPVRRPPSTRPLRLPLDVGIDGRAIALRGADDADLWHLAADSDWRGLLPGLAGEEDRRWLWARLGDPDDPFDVPDLARAARGVLSALSGTAWWVAERVAGACVRDGLMFTAWCAGRGLDPYRMPLHLLAGAGLSFLYEGVEDTAALDRSLWTPPAGAGLARWSPRQEAAAFRDAMASLSRPAGT